ncbi:DUF2809 domain-containing protein [Kitasatospora sp. MAP5-34]|uniref:ribosomal maturation YjgA family protein n=1 Tax=Kitasatospora sp. MAP5-34 TaxID=3035102 RepID=UPI00247399DE|nr:DUF2809 domain-containing protein [Kitasatospora sp. MAP5-34]MDH6575392.1 hypothetical protein [Kitasatospora sp. MAP5-34]
MNDHQSADRHWPTRLAAATAASLTVATGLALRAGAGGELTKYAGDALYTVLVHTLVVLAAPRVRPVTAATVALGVSWAVEFLQISDIPADLSRHSTIARLVLGSTFNPPDLAWYVVGAASAWLAHTATIRVFRTRPSVG